MYLLMKVKKSPVALKLPFKFPPSTFLCFCRQHWIWQTSFLVGRDIIGLAETGSGKTGAFALPILQALLETPQRFFALVLTPTRELAFQISEQFEALGSSIGVQCGEWPCCWNERKMWWLTKEMEQSWITIIYHVIYIILVGFKKIAASATKVWNFVCFYHHNYIVELKLKGCFKSLFKI